MVPSVLVLLACSGGMTPAGALTDTTGNGDGTDTPGAGPGPAELTFTDPTAGAYVGTGPQTVTGVGRHLSDVVVNGVAARLSDGMFHADLQTELGLNTFSATGTDDGGVVHADMASVLAGDFKSADGVVSDAVQLHVSTSALNGLSPLVGSLLDPAALDAEVQALNPILDTPEAEILLGTLTFDPPVVEITPRNGVLDTTIRLPNFNLPLDVRIRDALPFGIDLELGVDIECDEVLLQVPIELSARPNGTLDVHVGRMRSQLSDFDLDTGILEVIDWLFIDDDDFAVFIEDALDGLGPTVDDMVQDLIGGLDLTMELELLEQTVKLAPRFDKADVSPDGIAMSLGIELDVVGASAPGPGHLHLAPPPAGQGTDVHVQIADDFMNRALYELWAGGALDMELPLGAADAAVLLLFGGSGSGNLSLKSALPPVWVEKGGVGRLQMGEIALTVETPGGKYGEVVELVMALDAKADLSVTADAAGVVLTGAQIKMRAVGDSAKNQELLDALPGLETAMGVGIGVINEQLSFPLTEVLPAGMALPPIVLQRDPSQRASVIDFTAADLAGLLPLITGVPLPPPPPPLPPNQVPVPATATVLDDDFELYSDNDVAWICERDDVETSGNNGTWYLSEDASLVVYGTGHVIYAPDNADVRLEAPGNVVYVDPGANVDDNDGTNTVLEVDPLELELTTAPVPGCN